MRVTSSEFQTSEVNKKLEKHPEVNSRRGIKRRHGQLGQYSGSRVAWQTGSGSKVYSVHRRHAKSLDSLRSPSEAKILQRTMGHSYLSVHE